MRNEETLLALKQDSEFASKRKHYDKVSKRKHVKRVLYFLLLPPCVSVLRDLNKYDFLSTLSALT
jgi:hypothetical protein